MDDQMESTLRLMVWGVILLPMMWPFIRPFLFKGGKRGKLEFKQEFLIPPSESEQIAPRILNALKAAGFADQQFTPDNRVVAKRKQTAVGTDDFRHLPMEVTGSFRPDPNGLVVCLELKITTYVFEDTGESAYLEQLARQLVGRRPPDEPQVANQGAYWLDTAAAYCWLQTFAIVVYLIPGLEIKVRLMCLFVFMFGAFINFILLLYGIIKHAISKRGARPWSKRVPRVFAGLIIGGLIHATLFWGLYGSQAKDYMNEQRAKNGAAPFE